MKVTYLYHSGFAVEDDSRMLVFDYYKGNLPATAKDKKLYVFSSHVHRDHFNPQIFEWAKDCDATYILSDDIPDEAIPIMDVSDAEVSEVPGKTLIPRDRIVKVGQREEIELDGLKIKTLRSTDEGVAFFVVVKNETKKSCESRIEEQESTTIYHAGDLNWWHWEEETPEYNEKMKQDYQKEILSLNGAHIDIAFVPLDPRLGKAYGLGIDFFMKHTDTKYLFPMHLWGWHKKILKFLADPQSEGYREKIVAIRERGEEFEV